MWYHCTQYLWLYCFGFGSRSTLSQTNGWRTAPPKKSPKPSSLIQLPVLGPDLSRSVWQRLLWKVERSTRPRSTTTKAKCQAKVSQFETKTLRRMQTGIWCSRKLKGRRCVKTRHCLSFLCGSRTSRTHDVGGVILVSLHYFASFSQTSHICIEDGTKGDGAGSKHSHWESRLT